MLTLNRFNLGGHGEKNAKSNLPGRIAAIAAGLTAAIFVTSAIFFHSPDNPVYIRVFFWADEFQFLAGPVGVVLFFLGAIILKYRPKKSLFSIFLGVLAAGLCLASLYWMQVRRPVPPDWINSRPGFDTTNLEKLDYIIEKESIRSRKPVLYYLHADWCAECPDFERYVLGDPRLSGILERYILVRMDGTEGPQEKFLQEKFRAAGFPSIGFRDRAGHLHKELTLTGAEISVTAVRSLLMKFAEAP